MNVTSGRSGRRAARRVTATGNANRPDSGSKKALEERAQEKAESEGKDPQEAKPEAKAQYSFTDPESRIMKGRMDLCRATTHRWRSSRFFIDRGQAVTQAANDKQQMVR